VTEQVLSWENIVAMKPSLQLSGAGPRSRDTSAAINRTVFGKLGGRAACSYQRLVRLVGDLQFGITSCAANNGTI
jgi:hypothetical protein